MGWLKKESILVDNERHESIRIENAKEYDWKIGNVQEKWKTNGSQLESMFVSKK